VTQHVFDVANASSVLGWAFPEWYRILEKPLLVRARTKTPDLRENRGEKIKKPLQIGCFCGIIIVLAYAEASPKRYTFL